MEQKIKYGVNNEYIVKILSSNITDRLKRAKKYMKSLEEKKKNKGKKNYNHAESELIENCINSLIERISILYIYVLGWRMSEEDKNIYQDLIYIYFQQALLGRDNMKSVCSLDERIYFFNNYYIILEISILAFATDPDFRQQHDFLVSQQIDINIVSWIQFFNLMDRHTLGVISYLGFMFNKIYTLIIENKSLFNIQENEKSVLFFFGNEKFDAIRDAIRLSVSLYSFWNYVFNSNVSKKEINESKKNLDKSIERNRNLQDNYKRLAELKTKSEEKEEEEEIKPLKEFADMKDLQWKEITFIVYCYEKLKIKIEARGETTKFKPASRFGISDKVDRNNNKMLALLEDFDINNGIKPRKADTQESYKEMQKKLTYKEIEAVSIKMKPDPYLKDRINRFRGIIRKLFTFNDKLITEDNYPIAYWGKNGQDYNNYKIEFILKLVKNPKK